MDNRIRRLQRQITVNGSDEDVLRLIRELQRQGLPPAFQLVNARFGFATNSSSSHSIIVAQGIEDSLMSIDGAMSYGWGNFTLASQAEKAKYIATTMVNHYRNVFKMGRDETLALVRRFFDENLANVEDDDIWDSYIDHQSNPYYPTPRNSEAGMAPLWKLLKKHIVEAEDVVILGGNDNGDGHPLNGQGPIIDFYDKAATLDSYGGSGRYFHCDSESGHFTVFSPSCGTRLRFTAPDAAPPETSAHPELIDVKITDYCGMNCDYCYMDSTEKGQHARTDILRNLSYSLRNLGTFEVAIGGGEPTEHPDFVEIIRNFHRNGVIPSFSTQSWTWLEKPEIYEAVAQYCGAVALSTQKPEHIVPWLKQCHERGINAHFHYVLGLNPLENLERFFNVLKGDALKDAGIERSEIGYGAKHIVLLAHKKVGRAEDSSPHPYAGWGQTVKEYAGWNWNVAIDSFLVTDVEKEFNALVGKGGRISGYGVNRKLYENSDGRFSMYYDAVEQRAAAHSFLPREKQISVSSPFNILEAWNQIRRSEISTE
jgi:hypothetical protein